MSTRWKPKYEGVGPFSKLNLESSILSTEMAVNALGKDRYMQTYYWNKNYHTQKVLNSSNRLPDYDLDPPEDDSEETEKYEDWPEPPENMEEMSQMLGLHS